MDLEKLAMSLRSRSDWQAADLGSSMIHAWARPVYAAWLAVALPVAAVCILAFGPWGLLVFWWLLPLWETVTLEVLSRAVFGAPPSARQVLRGVHRLWWRCKGEVLVRRLVPARAARMPVTQLEGATGAARRLRLQALEDRSSEVPGWTALAFFCFQVGLVLSATVLLVWLTPHWLEVDWETFGKRFAEGHTPVAYHVLAGLGALAIAVVNPFFVASSFAIYLNRRVVVEGWDLDIAFRRMARRLRSAGLAVRPPAVPESNAAVPSEAVIPSSSETAAVGASRGMLAVAVACLWLTLHPASPVLARPAPEADPRVERVLEQVMELEELRTQRDLERWQLRDSLFDGQPARTEEEGWLWLRVAGASLAGASEVVLWSAFGLLALLVLRELFGSRTIPAADPEEPSPGAGPERVMGLDLRRESLPADVPAEAERLWWEGRKVEAASLLYRAALSRLHAEGMELRESFTESDCLVRARRLLPGDRRRFFEILTATWQSIAYAHRLPSDDGIRELCRGWAESFGSTLPGRKG
ncbi:MAG: DUF4129 domain-containing protein [Holophagales bacterium]|nr:DUF4129 domain-containing protein [Holophagales bacterium]